MHGGVIAGDGVRSSNRVDVRLVVKVNVRILNGPKLLLRVNVNSTVKDLRPVVTRSCRIQAEEQLLIYKGRVMKDDQTLKSLGVGDGAIVDMVICRATDVPDSGNANSTLTDSGRLPELVDLENSVMSALQILANNPETLRILYMNNSRMRAFFDRIVSVLRRIVNDPQTTNPQIMRNTERRLVNVQEPDRSHLLADSVGGRSQTKSGALVNPIDSNIDQMLNSQMISNRQYTNQISINSQLQSVHDSNPELRVVLHNSQVIRQVSPETRQISFNSHELQSMLDSYPLFRVFLQKSQGIRQVSPDTTQIRFNSHELQSMLDSNPQFRVLLQNSQVICQVKPETTQIVSREIVNFHRAHQTSREAAQNHGGTTAAGNMIDSAQEMYATELSQLWKLGFYDAQKNIKSLITMAGDLDAAVQYLLGYSTYNVENGSAGNMRQNTSL